jgi:translation initiation factor IF-2
MLSPVETEALIGEVEVRDLFRSSRLGTIAGCMVTSGIVRRNARVRIFRDGARIHETTVAQLKRFKDDAREVLAGQECGMAFEGYQDMRQGDVIECYRVETVQRSL